MRPVLFVGALFCAAACAGAVVAAWLEPRPDLSADDARRFTTEALRSAGLGGVDVGEEVTERRDGESDVWVTTASVSGGSIELWVDQTRAQALRLVDEPVGLVDEEAFAILDAYTTDPALRRRDRRNVAATAAGLLAGGLALVMMRGGRKWAARTP